MDQMDDTDIIDSIRSRFQTIPIGLFVPSHTTQNTNAVIQLRPQGSLVIATINPALGGLAAEYARFFALAQLDIETLLRIASSRG